MSEWDTAERERCAGALKTLDLVLEEKPEQHHEEVRGVLRCLIGLRDHLIQERRKESGLANPDSLPDLDSRLEHVNAVISVMTSGSFPVVGLNHDRLKQARDLLAAILDTARRE
jgi:hypothetical protein